MTDSPPTVGLDSAMLRELEALRAETRELRAAQAAGLDVLQAMSASPGDSQPVFDLIARQAATLCGVPAAAVTMLDGDVVHLATQSGLDPIFAPVYASQFPRRVSTHFTVGRAILNRRIEQIEDIRTEPDYEMARTSGPWSTMSVPLLRNGVPVGAITLGRPVVGRYSDNQVALLQTFAEQAVIAIASTETYRALQERTEALATRNSEYGERIEQQSASIEVLRAMSASPGDTQPVFDLIVRRANELCNGLTAQLLEFDGTLVHYRAQAVPSDTFDPAALQAYVSSFPMVPARGLISCRAILDRQIVHVRDTAADPNLAPVARTVLTDMRSQISIPLLRDGQAVGVISLGAREPGGFTDSQITLLQTFAEQAVIAIGNAQTYRALQEQTEALAHRNSEYGERIEQQSATIDVLKAMSASPGDARPVFDLIAERTRTFCAADKVAVALLEGDTLRLAAHTRYDAAFDEEYERLFPRPLDATSVLGRTIAARQVIQSPDLHDDAVHVSTQMRMKDIRSVVGVPIMLAGQPVGAISLARRTPGAYSATQIELLRTFAEQAGIAIGSAQTYRTLQERTAALARRNSEYGERIAHQSATIDVLKAMSASPGDTQPVFDLIVRHALQACNGMSCGLFGYDGELVRTRASFGGDEAAIDAFQAMFPRPPTRDYLVGRAILDGQTIHVRDIDNEPDVLPAVRAMGGRTTISMPLLRDGAAIGAISLNAREPGGFSDSQVELLRTFAEQAVIAMASAETYRALQERTAALALRNSEYGERIEQQSATIDVLKVMSNSPGDPQPVFELIARRALDFCGATGVRLTEFDGELQHLRALVRADGMETEADAAIRASYPAPLDASSISGRAILHGSIVHARDPSEVPPAMRGRYMGSVVGVPLLREGRVAGAIVLSRAQPGGFSDTQVELLRTFAEQAVIAIGGAETFRALQERTAALALRNSEYGERIAHQSATIDVLKAMSVAAGNEEPVLELIARHARELCDAETIGIFSFDGTMISVRCVNALDMRSLAPYLATFPRGPTREYTIGRAILDRQVIEVDDSTVDANLAPVVHAHGNRSIITLPFLIDDRVVGGMSIAVRKPGGLSDSQKALARILTEQAVIAIRSAETFQELRTRTEALAQRNSEYGERIEHQAATIDVLKAMSASSGDTQPVFDLIVRHAAELCDAQMASLALFDGEMMKLAAHSGLDAEGTISYAAQFPRPAGTDSTLGRAIINRAAVQIEDLAADPLYVMPRRRNASRSTMAQPLLRDGKPIGAILIGRQQPGRYSDSQIALLQTFAEQAVIAIISTETFRALQHRTNELSRSVAELQALEEVLRSVNSSLELDTVLATIISRSVQLSQADEGTIYEFDQAEQVFVPRSAFGMSSERVALLRDRRIRLGETHLGRSAVLRGPVSVDDVQIDPSVPNAAEALPGIHAVLAVPLLREDKVVGGLVIRRRTEMGFAPTLVTLMQTFAGQAVLAIENARLFQDARQARAAAETALADLQRAQDRLVQAEKMASLGQLTAGIAHEIKNPLNFVNNFSDLSGDLLDELNDAVAANLPAEIAELSAMLKGNLEKIAQHGRRADSIVRNMLLHSRSGPSEHRAVELNAVVEEALNLAYHGARAETPGFNITLKQTLDPAAGIVELYPQEFTRVMVNLINNGFYAARRRTGESDFEPTLWISTRDCGPEVEIRVRDNGTGISPAVRQRIFEPFFTTKPTGEGTGLGLSLSYDIIVKQHGGRLTVDSAISDFTEFVITLPRAMAASDGGQA